MSQEEDWYKAYETERLSLLNGGGKGSDKKNLSAADDLAAYYGAMQPESQGAPAAPVSPSIAKFEAVTPSPTTPPAPTSTAGGGNYGSFANEAEAVAFYAKGGGASSGTPEHAYNEFAFPLDYEDQDNRFGVKFVQPPPEMSAIKVGRLVYYAHVVDMYFKGFFTSSKVSMGLVVTPKCVWLGDLKTGNFIICKEIADIRTMFVLGEHSIGLRTGHGADVFVKQVANRERFVAVLKRLYAATGKALNVITGGEDREKSYRGEIVYLDREQWQYSPVVEDPRTGLELVEVPPKHLEHYGVLAPKNLHWFGGCNQVSLIGNNKMTGTRRGSWITPTGIFLSIHTGPRPDGSQIVRCISIDTLRCVVDGPGFAVGLNIQSNPPQPDLIIDYDDLNTKRRVLFILEQCYLCRTNQTLITRKAQNFAGLRLADDRKFVPQLFRMSTRDELYGLLRGKP